MYSTNHQVTSGFKTWNITNVESKNVVALQSDVQTFVTETVRENRPSKSSF